jgi:uncharacterized protein (DUF2461 family)
VVSGLFLRVSPDGVIIRAGAHGFDRNQLARYRTAVADTRGGADLATIVTELESASVDVGGETYSRTPRGFEVDEPAIERLLRHSALYAHLELLASAATTPGFVEQALRSWRSCVPIHRWLHDHVQMA